MLPLESIVERLLWAALLGAAIGVEREIHRRPSGARTAICISVGCAFFTIVSVELARATGDSSTTRIASNVVQGIGFLAAGAILRHRGSVPGLTTAASIFAVASMGMGAGAGLYRASGIACLVTLFALTPLFYFEQWVKEKRRHMLFRVSSDHATNIIGEVHRIFSEAGIALNNLQVSLLEPKHVVTFDADVAEHKQSRILTELARPGLAFEMYPADKGHD
jgi:putative Mg2+ transporter-C (MgtC) family protein